MFAGDYNGWADVPEDEREALDALDLTRFRLLERRRQVRPAPSATNDRLVQTPRIFVRAA
ncbi:MAG: hypothetical protein ACREOC_03070 [Gemmatimonadales bacterium]